MIPAALTGTGDCGNFTLAAFLPNKNAHFVDLDRSNQIEGNRIERSGEVLNRPAHRLLCHLNFLLKSAENRVDQRND